MAELPNAVLKLKDVLLQTDPAVPSARESVVDFVNRHGSMMSSRSPSVAKQFFQPVPYSASAAVNAHVGLNNAFQSGDLTNWTANDPTHTSVVASGGKNWAQIGPNRVDGAKLTSDIIPIPAAFVGRHLEVSFAVQGCVNYLIVATQAGTTFRTIPLDTKFTTGVRPRVVILAEELPAGTTGLKIEVKIPVLAALPDTAATLMVTEFQISLADERRMALNQLGLSATGVNFQRALLWGATWLTTNWDEVAVRRELNKCRQVGSSVRVWCTADNLSTFNGSGVWQGFNSYITNLDRFFTLCEQYGLSVIGTIFSQRSWSGISYVEQIVSDPAVASGYVALCAAMAARYKAYRAVVAWDTCNESLGTTLVANLSGTAKFNGYAIGRDFMVSAYQAMKAADPNRVVIATFGNSSPEATPAGGNIVGQSLTQPGDYCDAVGHSLYFGTSTDPTTIATANASSYSGAVTTWWNLVKSIPVPWFASEAGAPPQILSGGVPLYRIPTVNDDFLSWYLLNVYAYGAEALLPWRDAPADTTQQPLWTANDTWQVDGDVMRAAAGSLPARTRDPHEATILAAIRRDKLDQYIGASSGKQAGLTVGGRSLALILAEIETDATNKTARFGAMPYTNAQVPVAMATMSAQLANNTLNIGGGTGLMQAATQINWYTAAAVNTTTGTLRMGLDLNGVLTLEGRSGGNIAFQIRKGHLRLNDESSEGSLVGISSFGAQNTIQARRAQGTFGSQTVITNAQRMLQIIGQGHDGFAFQDGPDIVFEADETWSGTVRGSRIILRIRDKGTTNLSSVLQLGSDNVAVGAQSQLATGATVGFVTLRNIAGTPSGTPVGVLTGHTPIVLDPANNKIWMYNGAAWKSATLV